MISENEYLGRPGKYEPEKFPFDFTRLPPNAQVKPIKGSLVEVIIPSKLNKK